MNRKKIIIIIIILIAIFSLTIGISLEFINNNNNKESENGPLSGVGGDSKVNIYELPETIYSEKIIDMFKEANTVDYSNILKENEEKKFKLIDLITEYNWDMSEFNQYNCNYELSYVAVTNEYNQIALSTHLSCDWPEE